MRGRSLPLPVLKFSTSDYPLFSKNTAHIKDLLHSIPPQFRDSSYVHDFIFKQYVILKHEVYWDTIYHIQGRYFPDGQPGNEEKIRPYWVDLEFIGYQFRWFKVLTAAIHH